MAKKTKALSGPAKRKYFRGVLGAEPGVTEEAARRLADRFDADLAQVRVRSHPATSQPAALPAAAATPPTTRSPSTPGAADTPAAAAPFDPHAFSLIVVMTREGADGLRGRLDAITDGAHLRALARAQHVAIDPALEELEALRAAIVAGTAQRIADRRAAAS